MGKYTGAEKLEIHVPDARTRILGVEHPDSTNAMANLAATYQYLRKYIEAEKLDIKVLDASNRTFGGGHSHTIRTMENIATY